MPSTCTTFSLNVRLGFGCDRSVVETLNKACQASIPSSSSSLVGSLASSWFGSSHASLSPAASSSNTEIFVVSASNVELSVDERKQSTSLLAVLVPPFLIDHGLEKYSSITKMHASGSCFWIKDSSAIKLSQDLLSGIHQCLMKSVLKGIVRTSIAAEHSAPAEFVILELPPNDFSLQEILQITNGKAFQADPTAILKLLPLSSVHFELPVASQPASTLLLKSPPPVAAGSQPRHSMIPTCPVCLHRLDPLRLGLPAPPPANEHLCSKFCPPPNLLSWTSELVEQSCPNQRFLEPWGKGARCRACRVIQQYWDIHKHNNNVSIGVDSGDEDDGGADLYCRECSMHKTLWVCLTCGYVGCGRYSNRHSVQHFQETQHPYSLELATLRIWDYVHEDRFAHRVDLLECPSSLPLTQPCTCSWRPHTYYRIQSTVCWT